MPGSRALAFASRWFDPGTVSRVFEPLIADWQREWQSARPTDRPWIRMRGLAAFAIAAVVSSPEIATTVPSRGVVNRVIARVALFVAVVATVLAIPLVTDSQPLSQAVPLLLLSAIPSGAVLAFPFAMLLAVDVIRRDREMAPHVARATAAKLALAAVVFMVIGHGFLMPAANQQYRQLSIRQSISRDPDVPAHLRARYTALKLARGIRELTTLELMTDAGWTEPATRYTRSGAIRSELTNRAVLALMPAIFVWLRWIAHDVRRPRRFWPLPAAAMLVVCFVGFFASYWSGIQAETTWHLRPGDGLWLPIVIAALIGIMQQWITSRRKPSAPEAA